MNSICNMQEAGYWLSSFRLLSLYFLPGPGFYITELRKMSSIKTMPLNGDRLALKILWWSLNDAVLCQILNLGAFEVNIHF